MSYVVKTQMDTPHQAGQRLESILVEVRVAWVLRDNTQDVDQAREDALIVRDE